MISVWRNWCYNSMKDCQQLQPPKHVSHNKAPTMKPVLLRTGSLDARRLKVSMASMPRSVGRLAKASHMLTCRSSFESKPCSSKPAGFSCMPTHTHHTDCQTT